MNLPHPKDPVPRIQKTFGDVQRVRSIFDRSNSLAELLPNAKKLPKSIASKIVKQMSTKDNATVLCMFFFFVLVRSNDDTAPVPI